MLFRSVWGAGLESESAEGMHRLGAPNHKSRNKATTGRPDS